ncbi:Putative L-lactate dehydrogenase operon regulatory protein [Rosistilla ulvae]|uniref:L-lactate dehydrogenase operon regulatory protein n=1 Tax=Rosistilla ulvae TaxID=1930277 RepID=A0A517LVX2_9BACT|nr:FadR/GntR family transcriptional regulator [Rosistilla ulvae]QDS86773.1 Putative L-lactate dehydrogenase operon regulatory protein [Rosistilla ulvae]
MQLTPVPRRSSVDEVVERIRHEIESKGLTSGDRLPGEMELIKQLEVSRPVLREALARLRGLGLVEIQRGNGTFVAETDSLTSCVRMLRSAVTISPRELLSYTELRTAIEVQAVRQAAQRGTAEDVAELRAILERLVNVDLPCEKSLELDFRFHRRLLQAADNVLMQNIMEVIYEFVLTQMAQTTPSPADNALGHKLHIEIVDAIEARDPDAAELAMRQHMEIVLQRLTAMVDAVETEPKEA